jgi:hypothetical protein
LRAVLFGFVLMLLAIRARLEEGSSSWRPMSETMASKLVWRTLCRASCVEVLITVSMPTALGRPAHQDCYGDRHRPEVWLPHATALHFSRCGFAEHLCDLVRVVAENRVAIGRSVIIALGAVIGMSFFYSAQKPPGFEGCFYSPWCSDSELRQPVEELAQRYSVLKSEQGYDHQECNGPNNHLEDGHNPGQQVTFSPTHPSPHLSPSRRSLRQESPSEFDGRPSRNSPASYYNSFTPDVRSSAGRIMMHAAQIV